MRIWRGRPTANPERRKRAKPVEKKDSKLASAGCKNSNGGRGMAVVMMGGTHTPLSIGDRPLVSISRKTS